VTTLPQEQWTDQQVLALYQARWHIELLFKRIKQLLHKPRLRCTTAATALPTLIFLLVGWALLEEESQAVRLAMHDAMQCLSQAQDVQPAEPAATHACWWQSEQYGPSRLMDAGRNQCRSLVSANPWLVHRCTLSRVFTASASLFVYRPSQEAPSLQSGLSLAWHASDGLRRSSGGRMTRSQFGRGTSP
jgi:hypothetical protein